MTFHVKSYFLRKNINASSAEIFTQSAVLNREAISEQLFHNAEVRL